MRLAAYASAMAKKTAKPVIKTLGKRTGALTSAVLKRIVRDAQKTKPVKKVVTLAAKDTATRTCARRPGWIAMP